MAMDLGDAKLTLKVDDKAFNTSMARIGKSTEELGKKFKTMGKVMVVAGLAIAAALGVAVKMAADFESGMAKVNSMMGLGVKEFREFSDEVLDLSRNLGVNAVEATEALYQAISAGVPKENVLEFLEIATKAAIAGVTSTEVSVDGLTTVLNAFKIPLSEAQKVADILFQTIKGGKTTFEELSASLFNVAPIAAASNIRFEEVAAALAAMTKQGVPTKVATTQLRQAMVSLQKPTDEMKKAINKLGYSSGQAMIEEIGFAESLQLLRVATRGSNEELMKMFGSVEAGAAVLALTGANVEAFNTELENMKTATEGVGAATEAYNIVNESASRQFEILKGKLQAVGIQIGTQLLPYIVALATKMSEVVDKISGWVSENEGLAKTLVIVGGLLLGGGALLLGLGMVARAIMSINAALAIMHALSGPAGWAKLAIGVGIAATAILGMNQLMKTPEVPKMAKGGIVPGALGQPVPIIAHGGEQFAGVGKSLGGSTYQFYIGSYMGDESSKRELVREFEAVMQQDGRRTSFPGINRLGYFPGSSAP